MLLMVLGAGGIAWRLSQGPWELPLLARVLERATGPDAPLSIEHAALAWEGFARGGASPLDIRLTGIEVATQDGSRRLAVPQASVALSMPALLTGQVRVAVMEIDAPSLTLERDAAGNVRIARFGEAGENTPLGGLLASLASPPGGRGPLAALRRISLRDGSFTFIDRQFGATWNARHLAIELRRAASGGARATLNYELVVDSKTTPVHATATIPKGFGEAAAGPLTAAATFGAFVPADLAHLSPAFAPLANLHVPVAASVTVRLDAGLNVGGLDVMIHAGSGTVDAMGLAEPVADAEVHVTGTPDHLAIDIGQIQLAPQNAPMTTLRGHADLTREADGFALAATASLDQLRFTDLAKVWPPGVGGSGLEPWLSSNITAGDATGGQVQLSARIAADFSNVTLTAISGGIDGHDLTLHWLAPIPPVEHTNAQLRFEGPDVLRITAKGGRQAGTSLAVSQASVAISGLEEKDQFADIDVGLSGPLADVLGILSHPRLNLLARAHLTLNGVRGEIAGALHIPGLPLSAHLKADDVKVQATGTAKGVHVAGLVADRDIDNGDFSFKVSNDGLALDGSAAIAGIPGTVKAALDFRAGPASQVTERADVSSSTNAAALTAAGLDMLGAVEGGVGAQATWQRRRDGAGTLTFNADLTKATVTVPQLLWRKPEGMAARAQGRLVLAGDRITVIDGLSLHGTGIDVGGKLDFAGGQPSRLVLDRLLWEPGTDASLTLGFPETPQRPWDITVNGNRFDISALLAPSKSARPAKPPADRKQPKRGPTWSATVNLGRVVTGAGLGLDNVAVRARDDGLRVTSLRADGKTGKSAFSASITQEKAGYAMHLTADDAGLLLTASRTTRSVIGGKLDISATDPGTTPLANWSGTLTMRAFSVRDQPVLGKLLQAMTLYGVLDALTSTGVVFDTLIAPFHYQDDIITLSEARAFSASLGMTAKGTIDLGANRCKVEGTVVPAYFFNTLLGRMPLIGRLFSPEKGGGLFAATYGISGSCDDPSVGVNPLAALTPGFLRGVFGIFDEPASPTKNDGAEPPGSR